MIFVSKFDIIYAMWETYALHEPYKMIQTMIQVKMICS
jgi:hypothetical protein